MVLASYLNSNISLIKDGTEETCSVMLLDLRFKIIYFIPLRNRIFYLPTETEIYKIIPESLLEMSKTRKRNE